MMEPADAADEIDRAIDEAVELFKRRMADGREVVDELAITSTDYPTFAKGMRELGHDEETIPEVWGELRANDYIPPGGNVGAADEDDDDEDEETVELEAGSPILLVAEEDEASELAATAIGEAVMGGEVLAIPYQSEIGEDILDPLEPPVTVPAYIEWTGETFAQRDLTELFEEYG